MKVTINGDARDVASPVTVAELLDLLAMPAARVAVEINEELVVRGTYDRRWLAAGDRVEIVQFVGGG